MLSNNNILSNLASDRGLYRVWIRAHEGANASLVSVWIDPQMRAFEADRESLGQGPAWTETQGFETDACVGEEDEGHQRTEIARRPAGFEALSNAYGPVPECV